MSNSDWLDNAFNANRSPTSDGHGPVRILKGGAGSGNFGHSGRPGQRGGSAPKDIPQFRSDAIGSRVTSVTGVRGTLVYESFTDHTMTVGHPDAKRERGSMAAIGRSKNITGVLKEDVEHQEYYDATHIGDVTISYHIGRGGTPYVLEDKFVQIATPGSTLDTPVYSHQRLIKTSWEMLPDFIDQEAARSWSRDRPSRYTETNPWGTHE